MGLFGINDNLSTFALTKAKRAERKALEIESVTVTSILPKLDTLESKVSQIETTLSNLNILFNNIKNTVDDLVIRVEKLENI